MLPKVLTVIITQLLIILTLGTSTSAFSIQASTAVAAEVCLHWEISAANAAGFQNQHGDGVLAGSTVANDQRYGSFK